MPGSLEIGGWDLLGGEGGGVGAGRGGGGTQKLGF